MKTVVKGNVRGYNHRVLEKEVSSWWKKYHIYEKVVTASIKGPKFYFLDGPPYVTNPIHVGTTWNKSIKDAVIRFRRMRGYNVRAQPGFDTHGLPIEVMVEKRLKIQNKREIEDKITVKRFVEECRRFALDNLKILTDQFKDLGVWMDWDKPYVTLKDEYIESVWWLFKQAHEKGFLKRGTKSVHWCYRCGTVLSGYEVAQEYKEVEDLSVYVKFPIGEKESLLIWTTTPWTIPANVAVMVHPEVEYVRALVDDEVLILAKERCTIFAEMGKTYKILEAFQGKMLRGVKYRAPLSDQVPAQTRLRKAHKVILNSQYVTMMEGTGCVHVAPGHGEEDFEVGLENNLPVLSPVDDNGCFTDQAGKYKGKLVFDANKEILQDLSENKLLFHESVIKHRYPHCWRCKTPLILRTTDQWFITVSQFRDKLSEANKGINWVPKWAGEARFGKWLNEARDWVVSRQRYWGSPLPIWICKTCGTYTAIGSKAELMAKATSKIDKIELHRPWVDEIFLRCECGGTMERVSDIIDVWVDSGAASWACLGFPSEKIEFNHWWPADFIVEGHDQTRGWFYTLLASSIVAFGEAPYANVLMHGFTLDEKGREMHKSLGNFVSPEAVYSKFGRDTLRWFEMSCTTWEDLKFSWKGLEEAYRSLQILWNVFNFTNLYMSLDKFNPKKWPLERVKKSLRMEDSWLISKTERLKAEVTESMENLNIHNAVRALNLFILEDLSRWYIKLVRRRLWQEKTDPDKLAAYATMYYVLIALLIMCAPFIPFLTENLYQMLAKAPSGKNIRSVHTENWPDIHKESLNVHLEENMEIARNITRAVASARQIAKIKLRQPIISVLIATEDTRVRNAVEELKDVILDQTNSKSIEFLSPMEEQRLKTVKALPIFQTLGPSFRTESAAIGEAIKRADGREILENFDKKNVWNLILNGKKFTITPDQVSFKESLSEEYISSEFDKGTIYIDTKISKKLLQEGLARDLVRRIQEMRKSMDLPVETLVEAMIIVPTKKDESYLRKERNFIIREVRARNLQIVPKSEKAPTSGQERSYMIDGRVFLVSICPLNL